MDPENSHCGEGRISPPERKIIIIRENPWFRDFWRKTHSFLCYCSFFDVLRFFFKLAVKLEKRTCLTSLFLGGAKVRSDVPLCVYSFMYGRRGYLPVRWLTFAVFWWLINSAVIPSRPMIAKAQEGKGEESSNLKHFQFWFGFISNMQPDWMCSTMSHISPWCSNSEESGKLTV